MSCIRYKFWGIRYGRGGPAPRLQRLQSLYSILEFGAHWWDRANTVNEYRVDVIGMTVKPFPSFLDLGQLHPHASTLQAAAQRACTAPFSNLPTPYRNHERNC